MVFAASVLGCSLAVSVDVYAPLMRLLCLLFLHFSYTVGALVPRFLLFSASPRMTSLAETYWPHGVAACLMVSGLGFSGLKEAGNLFGGILADIFPIPLRMSEKPRKFAVGKE